VSEEEPDETMFNRIQTEFGTLDRRSRNLLGYLILIVMFAMATALSWSALTTIGGSFAIVVVVMLYAAFLGIPAIALFGEEQPKVYVKHRTARRTPPRTTVVHKEIDNGGPTAHEIVAFTQDQPQISEIQVSGKPESKGKHKTPDFSYRGEMPKRKRKGYDY